MLGAVVMWKYGHLCGKEIIRGRYINRLICMVWTRRLCLVDLKRQLTEARTRELRAMLNPQEGDVCGAGWPK